MKSRSLQLSTASVCVQFSTADIGYLCQSPEAMLRNAVLAGRLPLSFNVAGVISCDAVTGCEIVPHSLAYAATMAVLGMGWHAAQVDIRRVAHVLPLLAAEQVGEMI